MVLIGGAGGMEINFWLLPNATNITDPFGRPWAPSSPISVRMQLAESYVGAEARRIAIQCVDQKQIISQFQLVPYLHHTRREFK
jgi:hypothetical protein